MNKPKDTWTLAKLLEDIASLLKGVPNYTLRDNLERYTEKETLDTVVQDRSKMLVKDLKIELKKRGITGYSKLRKNELIDLLNKSDTGETTLDRIKRAYH